MILAEQGAHVEKWWTGDDPILGLERGDELWKWINHDKVLYQERASHVLSVAAGEYDVVIDNFRPDVWRRWQLDPDAIAREKELVWVSMQPDLPGRSFDIVAQARSWMEFAPYVPFYLGDTSGGLWLAFKALAMLQSKAWGHHVLHQAACCQKLVEGELMIEIERSSTRVPWDREAYDCHGDHVEVEYKGETIIEPVRDRAWKLLNLRHKKGRLVI